MGKQRQYGFHINSAYCAGCKTCQVACKDKNNLNQGIKFRTVYEICGGEWKKEGPTWVHKIRAYNLSISCNHCTEPECVKACPTGAMYKRDDGIVDIDAQKCMGCKYCSWACPYNAPKYNAELGIMTKCNLCLDYLAEGKNPACVDACPMRAIEFDDMEILKARYPWSRDIYPLPPAGITEPNLIISAHRDAGEVDDPDMQVTNWEEVG